MQNILILGAGGHARSVINLVELLGSCNIRGIIDSSFDPESPELINGYQIIAKNVAPENNDHLVLAIGDNWRRSEAFLEYSEKIFDKNLFHPRAEIAKRVSWGQANFVFAGALINDSTRIGDNNIFNSGCIVEHEVIIGSHCHISVGAIVAGRSRIGNHCFIGAGAVVIDKISVCDGVVLGANSTVISDIEESGVYVGTPARKIR